MNVEFCCHRHGAAEEEESVERIQHQWKQRMDRKAVIKRHGYKVEERQHRDDGHEHVVVYDRGIAGKCRRDHVADNGHNEESHEELRGGTKSTSCQV